jgi:hypothetical protein
LVNNAIYSIKKVYKISKNTTDSVKLMSGFTGCIDIVDNIGYNLDKNRIWRRYT